MSDGPIGVENIVSECTKALLEVPGMVRLVSPTASYDELYAEYIAFGGSEIDAVGYACLAKCARTSRRCVRKI